MNPSELPIIAPLLALLRSRKFLTLIAAIVVNVIIAKVPELATARDILIATVTFAAVALIGGIAYEDSAQAGREAATAPAQPTEALTREGLQMIIDALIKPPPTPTTTVSIPSVFGSPTESGSVTVTANTFTPPASSQP
ncbi:MAG: hypothetical protein LCI00_16780 [Chloroflexi bacterium]|nr:hypothetical protein [Chloroflexota bacterium]